MTRSITCDQILTASDIAHDGVLEGAELVRLFWITKQREKDLVRRERYWASLNDALTNAYEELERKTLELDALKKHLLGLNEALNAQLRERVRERSRELMLALRHAGMEHRSSFLAPGTVIGERARIVRRLGEGGMGTVYAAEDLLTSHAVAVKILRSAAPRILRYFVAEAEAASAVSHPAIVRTLHVDVTADGHVYQLMDLVDGVTLARRMRAGALPHASSARIGATIADALAAAHEHGVIHRDVKPENVLLSKDAPGIHVLDFGVAKRLVGDSDTLTDAVVGTPVYMSPDQIHSPRSVTPAADMYSLGVVLFEALARRRPFEAVETEAVLFAHLNEPAPAIRSLSPSVPAKLAMLVDACLDKDPTRRPKASALARNLTMLADEGGAPDGEEIGREATSLANAQDETSHDP